MAANICSYHASWSNNFDELPFPNKLSCKNLVCFIGNIFVSCVFSFHNLFIFDQKWWSYDIPSVDRSYFPCPSWRHHFDDLSILDDLSKKNEVNFIQKTFFLRFLSSYNILHYSEKWPTYDGKPDQFTWRNSNSILFPRMILYF